MWENLIKKICTLLAMMGTFGYMIAGVYEFFRGSNPVFYFIYTYVACWMLMYMDKFYRSLK